MSKEDDYRRYMAAGHAMQSGVAIDETRGHKSLEPKHLRVGVNSALVDCSAMAKLLMDKGIITEEEYVKAIADGMEAEAQRYEKHLKEAYGMGVTLA